MPNQQSFEIRHDVNYISKYKSHIAYMYHYRHDNLKKKSDDFCLCNCMYFFYFVDTPDKFKSILVFVNGLDSVPPLGFSPPLKLKFRHPEADENFSVFATPYANTCFNTLSIPVTETYNAFKEVMDNALDLGCLFTDH